MTARKPEPMTDGANIAGSLAIWAGLQTRPQEGAAMNRLFAVAALVALTVTSCAATWYTVPSVTGTSPLADNNQPVCSLTPDLWPVAAGTPRMMRATWTQGGVTVKADSVACGAGSPFTFPGIFVPSSGLVTVSVCAVDVGGIGCPASKTLTPTATTRTPAAPTLAP